MIDRPIGSEIVRVILGALLLLLIGALVGAPWMVLTIGLSFYGIWHLRQVYRLYDWLERGRRASPPEARGLWGDVFHAIDRLQRRSRKRKKDLRTIIKRFRESTEAMPDATVVLTEHGEIEWFNDAAGRLLGLRNRDIGIHINALVRHPALVAYLDRGSFDEPIEIGFPAMPDHRLSIQVIPYGQRQHLLMARDISRLKRLETLRRDFLADVSHELRTPLTLIYAQTEVLAHADRNETLAQRENEITQIHRQAGRMQGLIEDFLTLTRLESSEDPRQERIDVPALLETLCADARQLPDAPSIALEADADHGLKGAKREINSIFGNLISNAVRYTPADGEIRVRWAVRDGKGLFSVRDTGDGIASQHLPHLTERFYRVDAGRSRETGGTGLGLAIVKHALQRHGGRLKIDSTHGRGSTFTCHFPPDRLWRIAGSR